MISKDAQKRRNFWNSQTFTNFISFLAFGISLFALYRTEFIEGRLETSSPTRIAIASGKEIKLQGNGSDKILLSFSIYNNGATLKTIKEVTLTLINKDGEKIKFIADGQFDKLKNIRLFEFPLTKNENYSLVTAISVPPRTHHIVNYLFFYQCDRQWHSKVKHQTLGCGKLDTFELKPGFKYKARIHIDAFGTKSQNACFTFVLPQKPQSKVLDFSPIPHSCD
ncbi:MAG: hypothetical protein WBA39_09825 [Rivularia sp. (in: cyanobacteria)]